MLLEKANRFLYEEIKKRWPLYDAEMTHSLWVCVFPDETLSSFHLSEYYSLDNDKSILRLRDGMNVFLPPEGKQFFSRSERKAMRTEMEVSFSSDEIETVIPWVLDNYLSVSQLPEWLLKSQLELQVLGDPLSCYLWTSLAHNQYNESRIKREEHK